MKNLALVCVAALLAAPLTLAHEPRGTYKNFCEPPGSEWLLHEYGAPAPGLYVSSPTDGNLGGDCDPGFQFDPGYFCAGLDPEDPLNTFLVGLCDSELNPPLADWDGHNEFAYGGAYLLVTSGIGVPSADPNVGAGTEYCWGSFGHHSDFVTVTVDDLVLGAGAEVAVAADTVDLTGVGEGCGDFESDAVTEGVGTVTATFGAGLDGTYQVIVRGIQGHATTN